ncbi:hypothetical protein ACIQ8G_25885 [Streptomyces sp. NPDC094154]|uniref:hypothetical protein n=1 Tax=Streptomyces sp. NPDC094154 TaxID=3366059 RepID=UPI00382E6124
MPTLTDVLSDKFICHVLTQNNALGDDTRRDLEDGWRFDPASIPGSVALLYRLRQMNACTSALAQYWSALVEFTRENEYAADDIMRVMEHGAAHYLPMDQYDVPESADLIMEFEDSGAWVSVR